MPAKTYSLPGTKTWEKLLNEFSKLLQSNNRELNTLSWPNPAKQYIALQKEKDRIDNIHSLVSTKLINQNAILNWLNSGARKQEFIDECNEHLSFISQQLHKVDKLKKYLDTLQIDPTSGYRLQFKIEIESILVEEKKTQCEITKILDNVQKEIISHCDYLEKKLEYLTKPVDYVNVRVSLKNNC